jgi:2-methylfumaryl-CoA isomerase
VDFNTEDDRFEYREVLAGLLSRWFARADLAEVTAALAGTSLLWSTYHTFTDLVADAGEGPAIAANPMMALIDQPGVGPHLAPGLPVSLDGASPRPVRAPVLGEHTDGLLGRLGLSAEEVADLHERGVVRGAEA